MKIAVIMLHFGALETTRQSLKLLRPKLAGCSLYLINNTPADVSSLTTILPDTHIIDNRANLGFAKGVNQGIKAALKDPATTHFLLLNNDLHISFGNLQQLLLTFNKVKTAGLPAQAGIVAPILHHAGGYDWGGHFNRYSGLVKHKNWANKPKTVLSVDHVAGAAMLIPRTVIEKLGMLDERYFLYYEDLDFCLRLKSAGYTIHINPEVVADHAVSAGSRVWRRTLYQWVSHLKFVSYHLFRPVYPTAYLFDILYYPLIFLKSLL